MAEILLLAKGPILGGALCIQERPTNSLAHGLLFQPNKREAKSTRRGEQRGATRERRTLNIAGGTQPRMHQHRNLINIAVERLPAALG